MPFASRPLIPTESANPSIAVVVLVGVNLYEASDPKKVTVLVETTVPPTVTVIVPLPATPFE